MIDRLFTLTLAFAVIAGATLAVGDEFFSGQRVQPARVVAELPRVVITGHVQQAQTAVASAETASKTSSSGAERVR